jgi:hypothetical protein
MCEVSATLAKLKRLRRAIKNYITNTPPDKAWILQHAT